MLSTRLPVRHAVRSILVRCNVCSVSVEMNVVTLSALGIAQNQHVHNYKVPHEVDWNSLKVVENRKNHVECKVQEALHIFQRQPQMNRDNGVPGKKRKVERHSLGVQ